MPKKLSAIQSNKNNVNSLSAQNSAQFDSGGDQLQQIQHLLFGEESQKNEARLQELDARLNQRLDTLTQSIEDQLQQLNAVISEQLKNERSERNAATATLASEMTSLRSNLCDAVADLIDKQESDKKAFNQHINNSTKKLAAQFEQKNEQVVVQFQKQQQSLDKNKVSKDALSKILIDLSSAV